MIDERDELLQLGATRQLMMVWLRVREGAPGVPSGPGIAAICHLPSSIERPISSTHDRMTHI